MISVREHGVYAPSSIGAELYDPGLQRPSVANEKAETPPSDPRRNFFSPLSPVSFAALKLWSSMTVQRS